MDFIAVNLPKGVKYLCCHAFILHFKDSVLRFIIDFYYFT